MRPDYRPLAPELLPLFVTYDERLSSPSRRERSTT